MDEHSLLAGRMIRFAEERDQARWRRLFAHETIATLMLGTASVGLGIVMLVVTSLGLAGHAFRPWSEPRERMVETTPPQYRRSLDLRTMNWVSEPVLVSAGRVFVPSRECHLMAWVGVVLGGIGLGVSLRRRRFSRLSAIGFTVTLLPI